ncbi:class I SAM-dependent methyltransferase [Mycolicibacterium vaccae]|jgi:ubiquinone/menaquinone biosynthesis C-methylase UbiE|uniref:Type 11 methyltransferase n=1 Tax=Mycolicibacterium vaccae ATCC 25954 TaxID=1194972 RepID=K0V7B8_MYCVA|nr:class I SAM-dependent methyltransferase [Mycolicibacterium vaccae]ANI41793.1 ubiquinone biosynthesis methyltransferase UbiE [Mycolicibacterium vaccae 95051]EJZ06909.1 type 11 methyltransferase [Mycolicibacterium vaccae ATCC 25954]MCV7059563.1 class I SAM-dependent methyltransferase [Mycolicibacterium vaccae]
MTDKRYDVPDAFDAGARAYDGLVGANPGYHEHLRLSAQRMQLPDQGRGLRLLDIGCGTGLSTAALLSVAPHADIVAVDGSAGMLAQARAKSWPASVTFVHSRAETLHDAGVTGAFDGILAAYLIRNVDDGDDVLGSLLKLLKPGAVLAVHEYSVRDSRRATAIWNMVSTAIIIPAGRLRSGDAGLYRYLRRSVNEFDGAEEFRDRLRRNGFVDVESMTVPGWQHDIVHTFLGRAPHATTD